MRKKGGRIDKPFFFRDIIAVAASAAERDGNP